MSWKYTKGAPSGAQPAPATHALPPPVGAPAPAAALPVYTAPPAQAPAPAAPQVAAPAPAAEAAKPRRRRSASEIAAAQAVAPAAAPLAQQTMFAPPAALPPASATVQPQMAVATVVQPTTSNTPAVLPAGGFLALFTPIDPKKTASAAVRAIADQVGGELNLFPTIDLTGGKTGGMFDYNDMNEEGSDDDLPNGRKQFVGILFGYRYVVLGWPATFVENGPKRSPRMRGIISSNEGEAADLLTRAFKKYQFRSRPATKGDPEPFFDDRVHPAACVEALMFVPGSGIMCVRSTWTYESMTSTNDQIDAAFPNGQVTPTPVVVGTDTWQTKGSKGQPGGWTEHCVTFTPPNTSMKPEVQAEINAAVAEFSKFYAEAGQDPALGEVMGKWCKHDMSVQFLEFLSEIADT